VLIGLVADAAHAATPPARLRSRPDLAPPRIAVDRADASAWDASVLLTPRAVLPRRPTGPMILDPAGRVRWFHPLRGRTVIGLERQTYRGRPVLTWGERPATPEPGDLYEGGASSVYHVVADARYHLVRHVRAVGPGVATDLHDLALTRRGTALVLGFRLVRRDLRFLGGSRYGTVIDSLVQVVDVRTNRRLFTWSAVNHIPLTDSVIRATSSSWFDYFHANSVGLDADGNLLVSARHTWAAYKVSRKTGRVLWKLGGKHSSFRMGRGTRFHYQHDFQRGGRGTYTVFDNASSDFDRRHGRQSRVLRLRLDRRRRTARLVRSFTHPRRPLATSQGGARVLPNGNLFVGWGNTSHVSEFSPTGELVFDARLPSAAYQSYRAFKGRWRARPVTRPALAARRRGRTVRLFASWNGATEVVSWRVVAGARPNALRPVKTARWSNLETRITATTAAPLVAVRALDSAGRVLASSRAIRPRR
jgi:Arylsulfotransferase (ASST)